MARKKPPRMLIDLTQLFFASDLLEYEELGMLFEAIGRYSNDASLPDPREHSKTWNTCFKQMRETVDQDKANYAKKCETNRNNVNTGRYKRNQDDTTVYDRNQDDTTVYEHYEGYETRPIQYNSIQEVAGDNKPIPPAPPASEMQTLRENHQYAEQLIRRYGLPDNDPTLEAVLEDAEAHGWEKLEAALQTAALSNSRQKISVVFYRSILTAEPRKEPAHARADPYANAERF